MLDIISDYLTARKFRHQRLDGSTSRHHRRTAMEHFNAPGSEDPNPNPLTLALTLTQESL